MRNVIWFTFLSSPPPASPAGCLLKLSEECQRMNMYSFDRREKID